jgi:hypothetical protein
LSWINQTFIRCRQSGDWVARGQPMRPMVHGQDISLSLHFAFACLRKLAYSGLGSQYSTIGISMASETETKILAKLTDLENEISTLREGFLIVNKRYADTVDNMKLLTSQSLEAAMRSAAAAERAAMACKAANAAAHAAAAQSVIEATSLASEAAGLAALAASEAAASASAAASAAATAAANQAEEIALQASAEAARATARATAAAAEAAHLANDAAAVARNFKN